MEARSSVKEATIEATVIRANGDRENLGVVSYWHKSWYRRLWWRLNGNRRH